MGALWLLNSAFPVEFWPDNKQQFSTLSNLARRWVQQQAFADVHINNLSIIDETLGRSDVMAAAIPATNKWLLTKQASVVQSVEQWQAAARLAEAGRMISFLAGELSGRRATLTHKQVQRALEKKREGAAACTRTHTHTRRQLEAEKKGWVGKAGDPGGSDVCGSEMPLNMRAVAQPGWLLSSPVCLCPHRWLSLCAVGMTTTTKSGCMGHTWCPKPSTEGYSLIFHLTLQMPFFPIY